MFPFPLDLESVKKRSKEKIIIGSINYVKGPVAKMRLTTVTEAANGLIGISLDLLLLLFVLLPLTAVYRSLI
jgi:hypothetical protein